MRAIGYVPKSWDVFFEALLHRSYLPYASRRWKSNERLEFLGDAILNFIVAEHLYRIYPDMEEGDLTKVRSRLVNRRILATRAKALGLHEFILLSPSATQSLDSGSESILSDAFIWTEARKSRNSLSTGRCWRMPRLWMRRAPTTITRVR
jgi:ribonuclease-3